MIITQQAQNRHNIIARLKTEKATFSWGIEPANLRSTSDSSGFVFLGYPAPWCGG